MTDRHGQDSLPAFVEHFKVLIEAASASAQGSLTQNLSGAEWRNAEQPLNPEAPPPHRRRRGVFCHCASGKNSAPSNISERAMIEQNALANNEFLSL